MSSHTRLRFARERAGLTRDEVAAKLSVSLHTYSAWEKGRREPGSLVMTARLCEVLGMTIDWYVTGSDTQRLSKDEELVLAHYRNLEPRKQAAIINYITE